VTVGPQPRRVPLRRHLIATSALVGLGRRSESAATGLIALLVVGVTFVICLAPSALADAESESLALALADTSSPDHRLTVRALENFERGSPTDPLAEAWEVADQAFASVPDVVAERYGPPRIVVDSNRFLVRSVDGEEVLSPTALTLRVHPELDEHSRITVGRAARSDNAETVEIELSVETADVLGLAVGSEVALDIDPDDTATRRFKGGLPPPFSATVVGLRELDDVDDIFWAGDPRGHRPTVTDTGIGANYFAFALVPAASLSVRPYLVDGLSPLTVEARRDLVAATITLSDVDDVARGLRAVDARSTDLATPGRPSVIARLDRVLDAEAEQRRLARSSLTMIGVGLAGISLITLVGLVDAAIERRRGWLLVARSRGASHSAIVGATLAEIGPIAGASALVGWVLSMAVVTGAPWASAAAALATWASVLCVAAVVARRCTTTMIPGSHSGSTRSDGTHRAVTDAVTVLLAIASIVTVLRSGVSAAEGVDPLAAAAILIVPLAVAVLADRLLPLVLRRASRSGTELGIGRLVGLRRAAVPHAGRGLSAALVLSLSVSTVAVAVARSVDAGASATATASTADDPLVTIIARGHLAAALVAAMFAVIAVVGRVVVSGRSTRREIAVLTLLGAPRGELTRAVRSEVLPATAVGTLVGTLVGVGLIRLLEDRIDLSVIGSGVPTRLEPHWPATGATVVLIGSASIMIITALVGRIVRVRPDDIEHLEDAT
jgi:hypothetical protein